jgi:thioredoxin 1
MKLKSGLGAIEVVERRFCMKYLRLSVGFIAVVLVAGMPSIKVNAAVAVKNESGTQKLKEIKVTFIELGSVNCIPCKAMQPVMKEIEQQYGDQVRVVFHDVWTEEGKPYAEQYKIRAIPTQVFLDKNGKEYFRHMGFFSTEEIVKVLEKQGVKKIKAEGKRTMQKTDNENKVQTGQVCK